MRLTREEQWGLQLYESGVAVLRYGEELGIKPETLCNDVARRVHEAARALSGAWGGEELLRALTGRDAEEVKRWAEVAGDGWEERPRVDVLAEALASRAETAGSPLGASETPAASTPPPPPPRPEERAETARNPLPPPPRKAIGMETAADVLAAMFGRAEPQECVPLPPGIVGETAEWVHRRLVKPYLPTSIATALCVWGVVLGRKLVYRGQGPNCMALSVLPMSYGKTSAMEVADALLGGAGVSGSHVAGEIQSGSAGVERLNQIWRHPVLLMRKDEFERMFDDAGDRFGACSFVRGIFSVCDGEFVPDARTQGHGKANLFPIWRPAVSALTATQPDTLRKVARLDLITNGTFPRFIWILPGQTPPKLTLSNLDRPRRLDADGADDSESGLRIAEALRAAWDWMGTGATFATMKEAEEAWRKADAKRDAGDEPKPPALWKHGYLLQADEEVRKIFDLLAAWQERLEAEDTEFGGVYSKFTEKVTRVAVALAGARYAVGFARDGESGRIVTSGPYQLDKGEVLWAARWVLAADNAAHEWARANVAESYLAELVNRVRDTLEKHGGQMNRRDFSRALTRLWKYPEQQDKVLEYMRAELDMLEVTGSKPEVWKLKRRRGV